MRPLPEGSGRICRYMNVLFAKKVTVSTGTDKS